MDTARHTTPSSCSCRRASAGGFRSARRCSMRRARSASMSKASAAGAPPAGAARSRCRKASSPSTGSSRPTTTSRRRARRRSATSACAACPKAAGSPVGDDPGRPRHRRAAGQVINAQVVRKAATDRVIERNAAVQLCYVEVDEPDMHKPLGDLDRLKAALEKDWGWKDLLVAPHLDAAGPEDPAQGRTGASPPPSTATWSRRGRSSSRSIRA